MEEQASPDLPVTELYQTTALPPPVTYNHGVLISSAGMRLRGEDHKYQ